jgi:hypothetical protein
MGYGRSVERKRPAGRLLTVYTPSHLWSPLLRCNSYALLQAHALPASVVIIDILKSGMRACYNAIITGRRAHESRPRLPERKMDSATSLTRNQFEIRPLSTPNEVVCFAPSSVRTTSELKGSRGNPASLAS